MANCRLEESVSSIRHKWFNISYVSSDVIIVFGKMQNLLNQLFTCWVFFRDFLCGDFFENQLLACDSLFTYQKLSKYLKGYMERTRFRLQTDGQMDTSLIVHTHRYIGSM